MNYSKILRTGILCVLFFECCNFGEATGQDLYVSAAGHNSVHRYDGQTGEFVEVFVAPGAGGLGDPQGIEFGPDGNLYVASNGSNNVLRFDGQTGEFIDVFATVTGTTWPAEINFRNGFLYVSNFATNGRVSRFDAKTGAFVDHFISGNIPFADGQSWDSAGNIWVSTFGDGIKVFDPSGSFLFEFAGGGLSGALDNLFLPNGDFVVSSFNTGEVIRYDGNGNFVEVIISGLLGPQGVELGPDGFLFAGDFGDGIIYRYDLVKNELVGQFTQPTIISTTNNFTFRPVKTLLGDVNQDGTVDLLDVAPMVELIVIGTFQNEGDVNQDGVVDLLDVAPFVQILIGQ